MARKYQKFGLRADRNLSDLTNNVTALGNLLDDISVSGKDFIPEDLLIIDGLRNTQITPESFAELEGRLIEYTRLSDGAVLPVTPIITLQDFINNFKTIFGSPPFIGGGDGFLAEYVPEPRVTRRLRPSLTGKSSDATVSDKDGLANDEIFSRYEPSDVQTSHPFYNRSLIGPEYFWESGNFTFNAKLHPSFPNQFGLIQWTGYMSSNFDFVFEISGALLIEEDTLDDDNWTTKVNIYDQTREFTNLNSEFSALPTLAVAYVDGFTVLNYGDAVTQVAIGDIVTAKITGQPYNNPEDLYTVTSLDYVNGLVTIEGGSNLSDKLAINNVDSIYNTFELGTDPVRTSVINITRPRVGSRTKLRITHWYPRPSELRTEIGGGGEGTAALEVVQPRQDNRPYNLKQMIEDQQDDGFPFTDVYSELGANQEFSEYSYKVFEDVRGRPTNQDMSEELTINGVLRVGYVPPTTFNEKYFGYVEAVYKGFGRLECQSAPVADVKEGTWIHLNGQELITNGHFTSNIDGWNYDYISDNYFSSYSGGQRRVQRDDSAGGIFTQASPLQTIVTETGETYRLSFDVTLNQSDQNNCVAQVKETGGAIFQTFKPTGSGTQSVQFNAISNSTDIIMTVDNDLDDVLFDNISVRKVGENGPGAADTDYVYQVESKLTDPETGRTIIYLKTPEGNTVYDLLIPPFQLDRSYGLSFFDNEGLVGLYSYNSVSDDIDSFANGQPAQGTAFSTAYTQIQANMLMMGIPISPFSYEALGDTAERIGPVALDNPTPIGSDQADAGTLSANRYLPGANTWPAASLKENWVVAIYSNSGLKDQTTIVECEGVYGKELAITGGATTLASGSSALELTDTNGIAIGDQVQFGSAIPSGSLITVATIEPSPSTTITLSTPTSDVLPNNVTIIFVKNSIYPSGTSIDKGFCVIPLNTAPPFSGTNEGLKTTASNPNVKVGKAIAEGDVEDAPCALAFSQLYITSQSTTPLADNSSVASNATRVVPIVYEGDIYDLLIE